jgi:hypothetical protein
VAVKNREAVMDKFYDGRKPLFAVYDYEILEWVAPVPAWTIKIQAHSEIAATKAVFYKVDLLFGCPNVTTLEIGLHVQAVFVQIASYNFGQVGPRMIHSVSTHSSELWNVSETWHMNPFQSFPALSL